jgi:glycerol-3-phosphate cytidylyltransferase
MSDIMIVGVSTDDLVEQYKGHRPLDDFSRRFETICSVSGADIVIPQVRQFDVDRMKRYGVSVVVMGHDWEGSTKPSLRLLQEHVNVVFLPRTDGISSSQVRSHLKGR